MTGPNLEPPALDEEMLDYLEVDQLVRANRQPVPRRQLGRRAATALWALRVIFLMLSAMVVYTFIAQLG